MSDFITRYGEKIAIVYSQDNNMTAGAVNALKAAGYTRETKPFVISIGAMADGLPLVKEGWIDSTILQSPKEEAQLALEVTFEVCACESDSNGALTMQMMKHVDDRSILFADVRNLDLDTNTLRISNCGSSATELATSRSEVIWVPHGLQELPWKHGGMCPQFVGKPGRVTMARLGRASGRHAMLIAGGEALERPRDALKTTYWEFSPHTFIRPDVPGKAFVAKLFSNHIHVMYGDWRKELMHLCRVLDVTPIVPQEGEKGS